MKVATIELVDLIHDYLVGMNNGRLTSFLANWPAPPYTIRPTLPSSLPVLAYLPQVPTDADDMASQITQKLQTITSQLQWGQSYTTADFAPSFLDNYGWTELIGQRGLVASSTLACGFLLLGPHIEYPRHSHEAEEIYLPFTAPSHWVRGDSDWMVQPAHEPIFHPSWLAHGMKTGHVPLLALYLWRNGDLTQKSHILA